MAEPAGEPYRSRRSAWPVDRQGAPATTAEDHHPRHGFERQPDLWRPGRQRLQRPFRLHPLSPAVRIQRARRCRAVRLGCGNVHSANGWRALLEPVIARYRDRVKRLYFRGDAAFANPEMYEFLEAERAGYTIRLSANSVFQNKIGYLLKRPVGRPPHEVQRHFASFSYQA